MSDKVPIRRLPTGVPGLDAVLGGGVPEFSFSVIAGTPGRRQDHAGTADHVRAGAGDRPAIFFTVLGEPPLKMLRYQDSRPAYLRVTPSSGLVRQPAAT